MMKILLTLWLAGLFSQIAHTQITGSEQDCFGAIPLCTTIYQEASTYAGIGTVDDVIDETSCIVNGESNSVWFVVEISSRGRLELLISPISQSDDYDFLVYDLTHSSCEDIASGALSPVRCSWAVSQGQVTGLQSGSFGTNEGPNGDRLLSPINAEAGDIYYIMVDNFSGGGSVDGFTLDLSASTAGFDQTSSGIESAIVKKCNGTQYIDVNISGRIDCSSLARDGSDFEINGPTAVTIDSVSDQTCNGLSYNNLPSVIRLVVSDTFDFNAGPYNLRLKTGSDGNALNALCGLGLSTITLPLIDGGVSSGETVAAFNYKINRASQTLELTSLALNADSIRWYVPYVTTGTQPTWNLSYANHTGDYYRVCLKAFGLCNTSTLCVDVPFSDSSTLYRIQVFTSLGQPLANQPVFLVKNPISGGAFNLFNMNYTDSSGYAEIETIDSVSYFIRAEPSISDYPTELPTYYDTELFIQSADDVDHLTYSGNVLNFSTIAGINPGGIGVIGGYVYQGTPKQGLGDAVKDLELFVLNDLDEPVGYTTTNSQGYFEVGNLSPGSYRIQANRMNISLVNVPEVTLTSGSLDQSGLELILLDTALVFRSTNVEEISVEIHKGFALFPNPSNGRTLLKLKDDMGSAQVSILDMLGREVWRQQISNQITSLNLWQLTAGTYQVMLKSGDTLYYDRLVLQ